MSDSIPELRRFIAELREQLLRVTATLDIERKELAAMRDKTITRGQSLTEAHRRIDKLTQELSASHDERSSLVGRCLDLDVQLAAANKRLAWFDANKPEDMPDVQEAVIHKLGLVDRGALGECQKQLATVTEDRDKWEAVAKANQDEIDRFQKSFECAIDLCVTESDMPRKWARAIQKEHRDVLEALKGKP